MTNETLETFAARHGIFANEAACRAYHGLGDGNIPFGEVRQGPGDLIEGLRQRGVMVPSHFLKVDSIEEALEVGEDFPFGVTAPQMESTIRQFVSHGLVITAQENEKLEGLLRMANATKALAEWPKAMTVLANEQAQLMAALGNELLPRMRKIVRESEDLQDELLCDAPDRKEAIKSVKLALKKTALSADSVEAWNYAITVSRQAADQMSEVSTFVVSPEVSKGYARRIDDSCKLLRRMMESSVSLNSLTEIKDQFTMILENLEEFPGL